MDRFYGCWVFWITFLLFLSLVDFRVMQGLEGGVVGNAARLVEVYGMGKADGIDRLIRRIQMIGRLSILM